jgi:hypothetical protein
MQVLYVTLISKILFQFQVMILSNKGIKQTSTFFIDVENIDKENVRPLVHGTFDDLSTNSLP